MGDEPRAWAHTGWRAKRTIFPSHQARRTLPLTLMLYKFKSKATGDLIMLEPNGRRVLEIIGKDAGPKGIILTDQMPAAIAALDAAIAREEADQKALADEAKSKGGTAPRFDTVSLRQRAVPFLDMLRRAEKAGAEIVWGV